VSETTVFIVVAMFVLKVVESGLAGAWVTLYFRSGIPILRREYRARGPISVDVEKLEKKFGSSPVTPLVFRQLADGEYAFREKMFHLRIPSLGYTPIMHGQLLVRGEKVTVIGRFNWFSLAFPFCFVWFVASFPLGEGTMPSVLFPAMTVAFIAALLGLFYAIQASRYCKVGDYLAGT
jgi:hypothetical protein